MSMVNNRICLGGYWGLNGRRIVTFEYMIDGETVLHGSYPSAPTARESARVVMGNDETSIPAKDVLKFVQGRMLYADLKSIVQKYIDEDRRLEFEYEEYLERMAER